MHITGKTKTKENIFREYKRKELNLPWVEILDYEAKKIRNESRIEAVYNMLVAHVNESVVQRMYPEQFEAGKKRFVSSCHIGDDNIILKK